MLSVAIILGSLRPGRRGEPVAKWVYEIATKRSDAEFERVDVEDFNLPHLDEPMPPSLGQYTPPHTLTWAAKIDSFDAYVFVPPEYNHSTSWGAALQLYREKQLEVRPLLDGARDA